MYNPSVKCSRISRRNILQTLYCIFFVFGLSFYNMLNFAYELNQNKHYFHKYSLKLTSGCNMHFLRRDSNQYKTDKLSFTYTFLKIFYLLRLNFSPFLLFLLPVRRLFQTHRLVPWWKKKNVFRMFSIMKIPCGSFDFRKRGSKGWISRISLLTIFGTAGHEWKRNTQRMWNKLFVW